MAVDHRVSSHWGWLGSEGNSELQSLPEIWWAESRPVGTLLELRVASGRAGTWQIFLVFPTTAMLIDQSITKAPMDKLLTVGDN